MQLRFKRLKSEHKTHNFMDLGAAWPVEVISVSGIVMFAVVGS